MTTVRDIIDRVCAAAARGVLVWAAARLDPTRRPWIEAVRAELDLIEGGVAQLTWAVGGLRLVWSERRIRGMGKVRTTWGWTRLVAAVLALAAVGVVSVPVIFGVSGATTSTQCTSTHAPSSSPPAALVTARDYFAQGNYDYELGACARAIADYSHAIRLNPRFAEAYNNRAYTYMMQADYAPALPDLDRAIALRPTYVHALMNRADIYNYDYHIDRQRAIRDYDRIIALGAVQGTSVCGHRLLAAQNGWNLGTIVAIISGAATNCGAGARIKQ